ncbi:arsenic metallochaperone ArsD family protein [Listeria cornellensis]|uniref:Arsenical resistance operon trans-acting repressor ArsD n=1 Tax=Listeria cornellensis FSL F6-0969 TaxID=1265820 RepID=W7BRU1_9LIST|nr:arsenic metallochaperone ArsD family protein [Listeria cornellensis]EUJ29464.1 hypothetical protein PCORN_09822 [Listeria cornellensis FSL F6-0969]
MDISYYCSHDNGNIELEVFKSIHNDSFRNAHLVFAGEELNTHLYLKSESDIPFIQNKLVHAELTENGQKVLPIIIVNGMIMRRGGLLSPDELSDLLGIGIAIQIEEP